MSGPEGLAPGSERSQGPERAPGPERYRGLRGEGAAEVVIRRSRFVATAAPALTEREAVALIERVRQASPTATHHCFAYRVGVPGVPGSDPGSPVVRFSDDGEPSWTAGRPILEVIEREGIDNAVVVVTRFFGGVLLGAAGLIRAYAQAAKLGLEAAGPAEILRCVGLTVRCDYGQLGRVRYRLEQQGAKVEGVDYAAGVAIRVLVPARAVQALTDQLREETAGQAVIEAGPIRYEPFEG